MNKLLGAKNLKMGLIELTSKCNLRCVYCAVSNKDYVGYVMEEGEINGVIENLISRKAKIVQLNGHGETSTVKNWWKYCEPLLNAGIKLELITNGAIAFNEPTIEALARFQHIVFSIDTIDPELFVKLRRGGNIKNLFNNMQKIRDQAAKTNSQPPAFAWSCVLSDKNIFGVPALVEEAIKWDLCGMGFCNLTKYERPVDEFQADHVSTMSLVDIKKAYKLMKQVEKRLLSLGKTADIQSGFFASLEAAMEEKKPISKAKIGRFSSKVTEAMTRDCLDPWNFSFVKSDGSVSVCCWQDPAGSLKKNSYEEIVNNDSVQAIQRGLLTGDMHQNCAQCPARQLIPVDDFVKKVEGIC